MAQNQAGTEQAEYEEWLRIIGRHLDINQLDSLVLFETRDGFIVRATGENEREPEALEFPKAQFGDLLQDAKSGRGEGERKKAPSTLLPTGYEDFLRALGSRLDRRVVEVIVISELQDRFIVSGLEAHEAGMANLGRTTYGPFEQHFRAEDIVALLDDAFGKRDRKGILNRIRSDRRR